MGSECPPSAADEVNVAAETTEKRCCHGKNKGKVPKRIHKAEREKLKREQLNELFLELASALELTQPNNGKASILSEAARLLKDLIGQIDGLNKENESLLSESRYVTIEKNELKEENSALETQIKGLQRELEARMSQSKPDLNVPPPEFDHPELRQHFPGESLRLPAADATLQQAQAVFVVPLHPELQAYPVTTSNVSKPHARYPTPADSWPSQLLGKQLTGRKEVQ
ncbi:hypothetical protein P3X46_023275 [Hevea brasiliensis]|uniref:BHLH domain-containing protein n=1 Tax=Hevea brasiliensis TaxID=3981 RepID=A0ABQ9LAH2_HEVBR|nr:transcription factor bHLH47 [Hevea brasiliensis]KAJ9163626.1 hypothetical protein P3X46_023275 [Hevea brasiliensis]